MKTWLGTLGRAGVEFLLALLLVGLGGALVSSLGQSAPTALHLLRAAAAAMLAFMPLAGLIALFLSYFTVEFRIERRSAGLLAVILVALLPLGAFVWLARLPLASDLKGADRPPQALSIPPAAGTATREGPVLVWIRAWDGSTALNAVGADFAKPMPRLVYSRRAAYRSAEGLLTLGGRTMPAAVQQIRPDELVPEAAVLAPWWIWSRLAGMADEPLLQVLAAAAGFGLLAAGLRVLARLTGWPLANAFLAAAGLVGLVFLDALLSTPEAIKFAATLFTRLRIGLPVRLVLAACEGALGLFIGLIDLLAAPGRRRGYDA